MNGISKINCEYVFTLEHPDRTQCGGHNSFQCLEAADITMIFFVPQIVFTEVCSEVSCRTKNKEWKLNLLTGTCVDGTMARTHPECPEEENPKIHLLERIKNFQHERYEQVLSNGLEYYDILVSTGDEYCRTSNAIGKAHFRTYSGMFLKKYDVVVLS